MQKKIYVTITGVFLALTLAACSSGTNSLEDVEYSMNDATAAPSISFETPFRAKNASVHTIEEGDGEVIHHGDYLEIDVTVFSGADGSSQNTTYAQTPYVVQLNSDLEKNNPELYRALTSSRIGTSFSYSSNIVGVPDANGSPSPSELADDAASNVEVYTVKGKLLNKAVGKELPKKDINPALDSFSLDENGKPDLKLSKDRGDAPTKLVSQDLITGEGQKVTESDTIYVKYQGVRWEDGKTFEEVYSAGPTPISLTQVIQGWKEGLNGKPVGSRVLLTIPEDLAYGKNAGENAPAGALVFVVDILGSTENPQASAGAASSTPSAVPSGSAKPTETSATPAKPSASAQ